MNAVLNVIFKYDTELIIVKGTVSTMKRTIFN